MATGRAAPDVSELRGILVDSEELEKGAAIVDANGLGRLERHANQIFAEARGPYGIHHVTLTFHEALPDIRATCTCEAAKSRPFCKHAAALLIAWSRTPQAFVQRRAPARRTRPAKKVGTRSAKVPTRVLMQQGLDQVESLVRELSMAGVASLGAERIASLRGLSELLRASALRRLSVRTLELSNLLEASIARSATLPEMAYTEHVVDLLLTARKITRHLTNGEPLDERHVEELVGKTWRKSDRKPTACLDLAEYGYETWTTSDGFLVRESRFVDLTSGEHYSEKQILPTFVAARTPMKPSRGGSVLARVHGLVYPSYPPIRLEIETIGETVPLTQDAIATMVASALPDVRTAVAQLVAHRKDLFAPERLPVALRVTSLAAVFGELVAVDEKDEAIALAPHPDREAILESALRGVRLEALLGEVSIEEGAAFLHPRAAIVRGLQSLELRRLGALARQTPSPAPNGREAIDPTSLGNALNEVRRALAYAFTLGLGALGPRTTAPLEARLRAVGMAKQADLLALLISDEGTRLDNFVRLFHLLGVAQLHLATPIPISRAGLRKVPGLESVLVRPPERPLAVDEALHEWDSGRRFESALALDRAFAEMSVDELAMAVTRTWSDGRLTPFVVRAFVQHPGPAARTATRVLEGPATRRMKITAIRVLAAVGEKQAEEQLARVIAGDDQGLRLVAEDAVRKSEAHAKDTPRIAEWEGDLRNAPKKEARLSALRSLVATGAFEAAAALRAALQDDPAPEIRREAALGLALWGDAETVPLLIAALDRRDTDDKGACSAALALGILGDIRAVPALLSALEADYRPRTVTEALGAFGEVLHEALLDRIEKTPKLAEHRNVVRLLSTIPARALERLLLTRVSGRAKESRFPELAALYLEIAKAYPDVRRVVGRSVLRLLKA